MQQVPVNFTIGMLIFPKMTQLDFTGPFEVFARIPDVKVHVLWKQIEPVVSDTGLAILPTLTLKDCPDLDLICVLGRDAPHPLRGNQTGCGTIRAPLMPVPGR